MQPFTTTTGRAHTGLSALLPSPEVSASSLAHTAARMQCTSPAAVLDLFEGVSRYYRPSGDEEAMRRGIEDLVAQMRPRWPAGSVTTARDAGGNLLVRLPGTGRFAGLTKPVVLQSHMDMVFAVEGAKPGEDLRPYFKNGVQTEVVTIDGVAWIRAKDGKTTLGADDAQGMAVALRYLVDPSIEHPPLELVFTSREEVGLGGARQMSLPLAGRILLNLDTTRSRTITRGCMGVSGGGVKGTAETASTDSGARQVRLEIGGLRGGHSGRDAHRNRLNAIIASGDLLGVAAGFGGRLVSAASGDGLVFNKINDTAVFELTLPAEKVDAALRAMQEKFAALVAARDEDPKTAKLTATVGVSKAAKAFTVQATQRMGTLASVPNGLLVADPNYPDTVRVSANLGYLKADAANGGVAAVYTARAFTDDEAKTWVARIEGAMRSAYDVAAIEHDVVAPWLLPEDHWLLKTALALGPSHFAASVLIPASIECGAIAALYTGMAAISIGADVLDNHTTRERMRRDGLVESAVTTQALVEKLGDKLMEEAA